MKVIVMAMLGIPAAGSDDEPDPDERWATHGGLIGAPVAHEPYLARWDGARAPHRAELEEALRREGLVPWITRDAPGTAYDTHTHDFDEVRVIVRGAMRFQLDDREVELGPGDRLDLPAGAPHAAEVVDDRGVEYLCASRE